MSLVVSFQSVVAVTGIFPALAGVDLDVARGETVLLRGPNGSGKTTLLRAIAGFVPIVEGIARVFDHDLRTDNRGSQRAARARLSYLGHTNGLYDELTVAENLRFRAASTKSSVAFVTDALKRVGVEPRLQNVRAAKLSAGQRRRVALAALIAQRAELWLLDEPHASLDAQTHDLLDTVFQNARNDGVTIIFASHELERATRLATRIVDLDNGIVRNSAPFAQPTHSIEGTAPLVLSRAP